MSGNPQSLEASRHMALFEGAPGWKTEIERVYTFDELAQALWVSSGVNSRAAAWLGCSPNTITKRLKNNSRLRDIKQLAREAKFDRCESIVNDPVDQPCIYCRHAVTGVPDYLEVCRVRVRVGDDGRETRLAPDTILGAGNREIRSGPLGDIVSLGEDGHVILVNCDPTERRVIAYKILAATDRGYQLDREKPVEIDVDKIPEDRLAEVASRMGRGETPANSPQLRELLRTN